MDMEREDYFQEQLDQRFDSELDDFDLYDNGRADDATEL